MPQAAVFTAPHVQLSQDLALLRLSLATKMAEQGSCLIAFCTYQLQSLRRVVAKKTCSFAACYLLDTLNCRAAKVI